MWYATMFLSSPVVVTEPLVLAELSSSFSAVEQGRFSGAYQSIKGLTKIASPFLVMVLFQSSVDGYDCKEDGFKFRPRTGAIFYYNSAMCLVAAFFFYKGQLHSKGGDDITPQSSMADETEVLDDDKPMEADMIVHI